MTENFKFLENRLVWIHGIAEPGLIRDRFIEHDSNGLRIVKYKIEISGKVILTEKEGALEPYDWRSYDANYLKTQKQYAGLDSLSLSERFALIFDKAKSESNKENTYTILGEWVWENVTSIDILDDKSRKGRK